jgi:hypothetical protein
MAPPVALSRDAVFVAGGTDARIAADLLRQLVYLPTSSSSTTTASPLRALRKPPARTTRTGMNTAPP